MYRKIHRTRTRIIYYIICVALVWSSLHVDSIIHNALDDDLGPWTTLLKDSASVANSLISKRVNGSEHLLIRLALMTMGVMLCFLFMCDVRAPF